MEHKSDKKKGIKSIEFQIPLTKGSYQNNGANPWYGFVNLGSQKLQMKINFDTGARFSWLTSTQCNTDACTYNTDGTLRTKFDSDASTTFNWIDQTPIELDFGPWGTMNANEGSDNMYISNITSQVESLFIDSLYLVTDYHTEQFKELNWDGGVGVPTGVNPDELTFHFMKAMIDQGILDPDNAEFSYYVDRDSNTGYIRLGSYEPESSLVDVDSELVMPYEAHAGIPGLEYIWTTPLDQMSVGSNPIVFNDEGGLQTYFCLDSGASQLKGDVIAMTEAYNLIINEVNIGNSYPDLTFRFDSLGKELVMTSSEYLSLIEAGSDAGQTIVDIVPLGGLPQLALIGSLIMDHLYVRYIYNAVENAPGDYSVTAKELRLYNKLTGPSIINSI